MRVFGSIIWVLFSCIMIVGGIAGCFTPLETLASVAFLLPIFLIVSGVVDLVYYFRIKKASKELFADSVTSHGGAQVLLLDGIFNLIFAVIFIAVGIEFTSLTIVFLVAFVAMFRGILALIYAFDIRKVGIKSWWWILILGIVNIAVSMIFVIFPQVGGITIGIMISVLIALFGVASLLGFWGVSRLFGTR